MFQKLILTIFLCTNGISGLPNSRIIGGVEVEKGEVPYTVQIAYNDQHICGGTVISRDWILTAAQCMELSLNGYTITGGQHSLELDDGTEQISTISEIRIHPQWNSETMENDLALVKLSKKLVMNGDFVSPIHLPPESTHEPPALSQSIVFGWGAQDGGETMSDILRKVEIEIISDEDCRLVYGSQFFDSSMICAGSVQGGKDSCVGDSGGPMICTDLEKPYICGIVSWGSSISCGNPYYPGVYTQVSKYTDWIKENVAGTPEKCQNLPPPVLAPGTYEPKGDIIDIGGTTVYEGANKTADKLLIVVHDIFGFDATTNTFQFADEMNRQGYQIAYPNYFYLSGDFWIKKNFPKVHNQDWIDHVWIQEVEKGLTWEGSVREDTIKILDHYREQGITKFGMFGFCWGGKISLRASEELGVDDLSAVAQVHPGLVVESDADLAMCPNILLPANNDAEMVDYCERIKERLGIDGCEHQRFTDVAHGFASSLGDWNDELPRTRAEEVIGILSRKFCQYIE